MQDSYQSKGPKLSPFFCISPFPWHLGSLARDGLFGIAEEKIAELHEKWNESIKSWVGSVMVGSDGCVYILRKLLPPLCIKIPPTEVSDHTPSRSGFRLGRCTQTLGS